MVRAASKSVEGLDLMARDEKRDVYLYAKALVAVRRGDALRAREVIQALRELVAAPPSPDAGPVLALARNLPAVVISADLIGVRYVDPELDASLRALFKSLRETVFTDGLETGRSLVTCHERRPNNWGTHAGAARLALALYLEDESEVERVAAVFRCFVGADHEGECPAFSFGGDPAQRDLSWQCDPEAPLGINASSCGRLSGVLADDQRRSGPLSWPPAKQNYVYESLQGLGVTAAMLDRQGIEAWTLGDAALRRAFDWLHAPQFLPTGKEPYPATGTEYGVSDDRWLPFLWNAAYNTSYPTEVPAEARVGKNLGFTDWTHAGR